MTEMIPHLHSTAEDSDAIGKGSDSLLKGKEEALGWPSLTAKTSISQAIMVHLANF